MDTTSKIELRPLAGLRPHPATKHLYTLTADHPVRAALADSMRAHGYDPDKPLTITADGHIVDGRHRFAAAKAAGLDHVPCVVISDDRVQSAILDSIAARKHFTKSALAFEIWPILKPAVEEARRGAANKILRKSLSDSSPTQSETCQTIPELAFRYGISQDLLTMAEKVHEAFRADPAFAAEYLPKLYACYTADEHADASTRAVGLGGIIKAWGYHQAIIQHPGKARGGRPEEEAAQMQLFTRTVSSDFRNRWEYWQAASDESKAEVIQAIRKAAAQTPQDQCEAMAEFYATLAKTYRAAARRTPEAAEVLAGE